MSISDKEFHQRLNELKDLWLKEFNLKNLENDYIPKLPQEVKDYIGNLDMKITQGSFIKLLLKNREDMISFIKPTIENPNFALDNGRGILFIKEFTDENKNTYFMSVAKNYDGEWIFASHTKRELENVKNEIKNSKIIINKGFERSEVAGACDILESGGEVSKPSHLQIKYTANQDFGTNPLTEIIPQNQIQSQAINKLDETISKLDKALEEQNLKALKSNYKEKEIENKEPYTRKHTK